MLPTSKRARTAGDAVDEQEGAVGGGGQNQDAAPAEEEEEGDEKSTGEDEGGEGSEEESESDSDDSDAEEMVLDELGRIPGGMPGAPCFPDLNYELQSYPKFLDFGNEGFEKSIKDCRAAFTARSSNKGGEYSMGETYWVAADATPRVGLEKLARTVFDKHTSHLTAGKDYNPATSGAEWWTLVLDGTDDVGLHWDRDYALEGESGILVHPHLATVTYLTAVGGPTIVLNRESPMQARHLGEIFGPIESALLSRPVPGKHIVFDGRLLHGAPADADAWALPGGGAGAGPRITFLVNIWLNHCPSSAEAFPDDKIGELSDWVVPESAVASEEGQAVHVSLVEHAQAGEELTQVTMAFKAEAKAKVNIPLPLNALKGKLSQEGGSYLMAFGDPEVQAEAACACAIVEDRKMKVKERKQMERALGRKGGRGR